MIGCHAAQSMSAITVLRIVQYGATPAGLTRVPILSSEQP